MIAQDLDVDVAHAEHIDGEDRDGHEHAIYEIKIEQNSQSRAESEEPQHR